MWLLVVHSLYISLIGTPTGAKYTRILGRGCMPNILGFLAGGAKYPRIFGRGCLISYSLMGVPVFLKGC